MRKGKDELTEKLEQYICKYYKNISLRGSILFIAIFLALFLCISLFEYLAYSNTWVRTLIFYGFLLLNAAVLAGMIIIPLCRKVGWLKRMSYEEAARRIGAHFPEIDDKLLNTLQLHGLSDKDARSRELLHAAIDRRISQMKPFHFHKAVDFRKNLKYVKYAAVPALIILLLLFWNSELFTGPTRRIIHHQTTFEKPAPYRLEWEHPVKEIIQNENLPIKVKVEGKESPDEAFIEVDGIRYRMEKTATSVFEYELKNLRNDVCLRFTTEEVQSPAYDIRVLPKPTLLHFSLSLSYPAYLHKIEESVENNGNLSVPQGTRITWKFRTAHSDEVVLTNDSKRLRIPCSEGLCSYQLQALSDFAYTLSIRNRYLNAPDSLSYHISVIPDAYPEIRVESSKDSLYFDRFYFKGNILDDYGFKKLQFVYFITKEKDTTKSKSCVELPLRADVTAQDFYYYFDAQTLSLELGETLHYYFEVWDNDGVNGSKLSRTHEMQFKLPTAEEIRKQSEETKSQTKSELSQVLKENEDLMRRIDELKKKMISQKDAGWQEKKEMEELLKQWQKLKKDMQSAVEEQKRQQEMEEQYETASEEILRKQDELQRRMDELFTDEMKETMMEIQRMMEKDIDKEKLNQALDKIRLSTEELNKQLDQDLSLFKQLEVEEKMDNILQQTEKLAEKQLELAKESAQRQTASEEMLQKQQKIENEFKQLMDDVKELQEMNKKLDNPLNIPDQKEMEKSIRQEMQQAGQQLQKQKNKEASQHQQKAGEKMQQMQQQMESAFQQGMDEGAMEDAQAIRKILNHIVQTSFQQEKLMKRLSQLSMQDPEVKEVLRRQFVLKDNLRLIEDSIAAIARRQQAVKPFINKQIAKINAAQQQILSAINQSQEQVYYYRPRNFNNAISKQQYVMTSLNDLALMLAESMNNMQKQQGSKGGACKSGQCKQGQSGGGKDSKDMKSLRDMQEQLNKQLEEMRKQQGGQQDKGGQGKKPGQNGKQQSEQFARAAARQEAIRRMTQEHLSKMQKQADPAEIGNMQRAIRQMEQTEKELVNKILNQETINRQREITTRMLQSERAEMQREKDNQRESRQGKDMQRTPPPDWSRQQSRQKQQTEMYQTVPPSMSPFYKQKVHQYFYHFE